jgi:hypothetical protein
MILRSKTPVVLAGTNIAEMAFEELLAAGWAAQLAQLRAHSVSGDSSSEPHSQVTTGKEGDTA